MKGKTREIWERIRKEIIPWIPKRIIDIHVHAGLPGHVGPIPPERKKVMITQHRSISVEGIKEAYKNNLGLDPKNIEIVAFPFPLKETKIKEANDYILEKADFPVILADLKNPKKTVELLKKDEVVGIKPYHDLLDKPYQDREVKDVLLPDFLDVINKKGKIIMLHVPGTSIADEKNISQVEEIAKKYPNAKIILAHMGRLFEPSKAEEVIKRLKPLKNVFMETSACTDKEVFKIALKHLGPDRILYGSDIPFTSNIGRIFSPSELEKFGIKLEKLNLDTGLKKMLKGGILITSEKHPWTIPELRKAYLRHADKFQLTFMWLHELKALKDAIQELYPDEIEQEKVKRKIFYENARKILASVHRK